MKETEVGLYEALRAIERYQLQARQDALALQALHEERDRLRARVAELQKELRTSQDQYAAVRGQIWNPMSDDPILKDTWHLEQQSDGVHLLNSNDEHMAVFKMKHEATLAAAAPELFRALNGLLAHYKEEIPEYHQNLSIVVDVEEVLRKARGE